MGHNNMFAKCKCLIVNLVFPTSVFGVGISFDCTFSWSLPTCTSFIIIVRKKYFIKKIGDSNFLLDYRCEN